MASKTLKKTPCFLILHVNMSPSQTNLDQAKEELLLFLKTPVIDATVHNSIEVQVPQIQPKTKQVSEDEFPPFILGVFLVTYLSATLSGRGPGAPPRCQGTSCQTHMAGHSFWHGGMVPSEPPNGRSQERPWLKKTQRYPRTHS